LKFETSKLFNEIQLAKIPFIEVTLLVSKDETFTFIKD
jgi:hypothetical protein